MNQKKKPKKTPRQQPITKADIIAELKRQRRDLRDSYREGDRIVRDKDALRSIALLQATIKIVQKSA